MITAKQDNIEVPVYDLIAKRSGEVVGLITNFPGEGVVFTLRAEGVTTTDYSARTIHAALDAARTQYDEILKGHHWLQQVEDHIEDEDGELAAMRAAEDKAEYSAMLDEAFGYPEYH
jgi:RPA family protein